MVVRMITVTKATECTPRILNYFFLSISITQNFFGVIFCETVYNILSLSFIVITI